MSRNNFLMSVLVRSHFALGILLPVVRLTKIEVYLAEKNIFMFLGRIHFH